MGDFLINNPQDYEHVDPVKADFLDLDFIDKKQPYLPTPSKAFKHILDAAGVYYNENEFFQILNISSQALFMNWMLKSLGVRRS